MKNIHKRNCSELSTYNQVQVDRCRLKNKLNIILIFHISTCKSICQLFTNCLICNPLPQNIWGQKFISQLYNKLWDSEIGGEHGFNIMSLKVTKIWHILSTLYVTSGNSELCKHISILWYTLSMAMNILFTGQSTMIHTVDNRGTSPTYICTYTYS